MSKLDELIKELCPNGVEYKELGKVLDYIQPTKYIVESTEYKDEYNIPVLTAGQTFILGYTDETKGIYEASKENPVIIFDDFMGSMHWINFKFKIKSSAMKIIIPRANETLNFKYFYYLLKNIKYSSETHTRLWISVFSKFLVPVPPLEVQHEIVRILDNYTKSVEELKEKLKEELIARRNQYSWYRDYLLKFENKIEIVKLGSVSNIVRGASPRPISNYITFEEDGINWIKIGDVNLESKYVEKTKEKITQEGAKKSRIVKKGDLILSNSMSFGRPYIVNQEGCIHDGWILISDYQTNYSTDFLYYLLMSNKVQKYMRDNVVSGTVQNLNIDIVKNIEIPLPPLEVQKRIVEVLDNFEKTCKELNIELSSEIEIKQKEYEFIRNYLLTFNNEEIYALSKQASKQAQNLIKILQYVYGYVEVRLGDIGKVSMCRRILKSETNSIGGIPFFKIGTFGKREDAYISIEKFYEYKEKYPYPKKGMILISTSGTIGRTVVFDGKPAYYQDSNIVWIDNDEERVLNKYLYYFYQTNPWKIDIGGTIERLYNENIEKTSIPLPPLEEQQRIVDILDRFDRLCNDISEGLPAEIEARQKQYEYYREKLLTFKKL